MKRITLIVIICLTTTLSCKCGIPSDIRNAFSYCYDGKYTGLDTLININGYYGPMTFYTNGLVIDHGPFSFKYNNVSFRNDKYFFSKGVAENPEAKDAKRFYNNATCGGYRICGDTIKVQRIHKSSSWNDGWTGYEECYKIVDKNTLQCIDKVILTTNKKEIEFHRKYYSVPISPAPEFNFTPVLPKPQEYLFWIFREKWFWCNESDWKSYMERIKQKKAELKKENEQK